MPNPPPLPLLQSGSPTPVQSVNGNTARHYVKLWKGRTQTPKMSGGKKFFSDITTSNPHGIFFFHNKLTRHKEQWLGSYIYNDQGRSLPIKKPTHWDTEKFLGNTALELTSLSKAFFLLSLSFAFPLLRIFLHIFTTEFVIFSFLFFSLVLIRLQTTPYVSMMGLIEVLQETSQPHRVMITNTEKIHNSQSSAGTNTGFEFFFLPFNFFSIIFSFFKIFSFYPY